MNAPGDPGNQRLGKGMIIAAWVLGLVLIYIYFSNFLEQERNPDQSISVQVDASGVAEVHLQRNRYGHYVTNGMINGTEVEFMLDTGASDVAIPSHIAKKLNLFKGIEKRYRTANGIVIAYTTVLDSLRIGPIRLEGVRASINPGLDGDGVLLGMSALKQIEFTQKGDKLILRMLPSS